MPFGRLQRVSIALAAVSIAIAGCSTSSSETSVPPVSREGWIVDTVTRCGTTNTFAKEGESIQWYGACRNGALHGYGTLIWFRSAREIERNEGMFKAGEFDGRVITTFPAGHAIVGDYSTGQRNGVFFVIYPNGVYVRAVYRSGTLVDQQKSSAEAFSRWHAGQPETRATKALNGALARISRAVRGAPVTPHVVTQPTSQWLTAEEFHSAKASGRALRMLRRRATTSRGWLFADKFRPSGDTSISTPSKRLFNFRPISHVTVYSRKPSAIRQEAVRRLPVPAGPDYWRIATLIVSGSDTLDRADARSIKLRPPPVRQALRPVVISARAKMTPDTQSVADKIFADGFRNERAGEIARARAAYEQLLTEFPSAPATVLANDRLRRLDQARSVADTRDVIAVNSAKPVPERRAIFETVTRHGGLRPISAAVSRHVCTDHGLYQNDTAWCGVVIRETAGSYWVEVRDVRLRGFGTFGIRRSTCSGNTLLTWFSPGITVRVPKACMVFADTPPRQGRS